MRWKNDKKKNKNWFLDLFLLLFAQRYNIHIRDHNQPLIMTKAKQKDLRGGRDDTVMLIPELCRATGITDRMRNDFQ